MTSLQEENSCHTVNTNDLFTMEVDDVDTGLHFPLSGSMNVVFTGYYNGLGVEVKSDDELGLLYHMGCFGKGSASRSRPKATLNNGHPILRKRQFLKRTQWSKKYVENHSMSDADLFLKDVEELTLDILRESKKKSKKDVIDLVSSDDSDHESNDNMKEKNIPSFDKQDKIVVVVPNSESEDDNYFANLKPMCCLNKTKLDEKLMLTAQEAFFLMYGLGCLQVVHCNQVLNIEECWKLFNNSDSKFVEKYIVYHYFRSKGYIVKPGIKFGGDYMLYKEGPEDNHADYIVVIRFSDDCFDWISTLGHVRVANTTSKQVLITEVINKSNTEALQLPQDLSKYSVREVLLNRNIPVALETINEDIVD